MSNLTIVQPMRAAITTRCPLWCQVSHHGQTAGAVHSITVYDEEWLVVTVAQQEDEDGRLSEPVIRYYQPAKGPRIVDFDARGALVTAGVFAGKSMCELKRIGEALSVAAYLAEQAAGGNR